MSEQDTAAKDAEYEKWKRANDLDRRGFPQFPVLPSESVAARIANNSAKAAGSWNENDA